MIPRGARRNRGFALIVVLWAALILSIAVAGILAMSRTETRIVMHRETAARATAIADGALRLVLMRLVEPDGAGAECVDGTSFAVPFANRSVRVSIEDESGKVDLNTASGEMVSSLLETAGLDPMAAAELSDKILDWRERGPGKRMNGAKADDYRAAGYSYGPRQAPFPNVAELKLVMGVTRELYERIVPALTIYSQNPVPNPEVTPREVIPLLPETYREIARRTEETRRGGDSVTDETSQACPRATGLIGHALTVTVMLGEPDGTAVSRTAIVRITGHTNRPLWIYRWD